MARRRNAVRLGIPAAIVGTLALVALWRMGPPPGEPDLVATSGIVPAREATIEGIAIRQVTSATSFWAGKIDEEPVFVVLDGNVRRGRGVRLAAGSEVALVGEVHPAPEVGEMQQRWRVDEATARAVAETGRYLLASEIRQP